MLNGGLVFLLCGISTFSNIFEYFHHVEVIPVDALQVEVLLRPRGVLLQPDSISVM